MSVGGSPLTEQQRWVRKVLCVCGVLMVLLGAIGLIFQENPTTADYLLSTVQLIAGAAAVGVGARRLRRGPKR